MTEAFQEAEEPQVEITDEDDEDSKPVESPTATRNSPTAIAAFVIALLSGYGLSGLVGNAVYVLSVGAPSTVREFARALGPLVAPFFFAFAAIWLASRAEDEIFTSDGTLGGVGFYRAARLIAIVVLIVVALSVVASLLLGPEPFRPG